MDSKVKVYGHAQNRTALGIVNAYLKINPNATLADLRAAFPDALNPDMGVKEIFIPASDAPRNAACSHYFDHPDELLKLSDGQTVAMTRMWTHASFERLVNQARQYGIEVADFSKTDRGIKGSYNLEYLNGFAPAMVAGAAASVKSSVADSVDKVRHMVEEPVLTDSDPEQYPAPVGKSGMGWLWWLLALIFLAIIVLMCVKGCTRGNCADGACATDTTTVTTGNATSNVNGLEQGIAQIAKAMVIDAQPQSAVAVADTVTADEMAQLAQCQQAFNDVEFQNGTTTLNANGAAALDNLVALLQSNPNLHLQIIGHASADGPEQLNQRVSERRAQTVAEYLEAQGIDGNRLAYVGWGEINQPDAAHPYAIDNRCVTFELSE